jgi:hypothetical protein
MGRQRCERVDNSSLKRKRKHWLQRFQFSTIRIFNKGKLGYLMGDISTNSEKPGREQGSNRKVNPYGLIGVVLSAVAFAIGLYSTGIIGVLEARKVPDRHYETDDATIITDKAGNAVTFVEQAIVFVCGGLVCGTLALVALVLGCVAVVRSPRIYGAIAIVLSLATFSIMFGR